MRAVEIYKQALLFGAVGLAVASTAGAQVIRCEQFAYADGSLVPNGGWASHSGTAGDFMVTGGEAIVQHGSPSEDVNLSFTPVAGNIYFGIDVTVDDPGGPIPGTDNEYFAHFKDTGFNFAARLDVVPPTSTGDYSLGIASDDSTADAIWPNDLTYGTTYRVVVRYDQDANIAELWVNPTVSTDLSILGDDKADPGDTISQFAMRQSDSDMNETVRIDNLMIGQMFGDVVSTTTICGTQTPRFATVPNPAALNRGNAPHIGTTWNPTITASGAPGITDILIVSFQPGIETVTTLGTLLCNIPPPAFIFAAAPGAPFAVTIPSDPAIIGVPLCTQGASVGAIIELTNALDITLGG